MFIKRLSTLFITFSFTLLLTACSESTSTPEDEIRAYIEQGKVAAENRSASELAELVHDNYQDQKKLDKQSIKKLARAYFFRHKNINLFTQIDSINFQSNNSAFVVVYVAMAGNRIDNINALTSLRARIYKFELQLVKEDEWLLQQARWQPAAIKDML